ncbi:MAG: PIN domain-containing protein [Thermoplasmatota archaeon]
MKLVIDTNVLFTFFWKASLIHDILILPIHFISSEYALTEITHHKQEIIKKAKLSSQAFQQKIEQLAYSVEFVSLSAYESYLKQASQLMKKTDQKQYQAFSKDIDFYTLALSTDAPIWTNDRLFKQQETIMVFTTKEIIKLCRHLR